MISMPSPWWRFTSRAPSISVPPEAGPIRSDPRRMYACRAL
jgi:hypothetical protein